jgi:hypothetical protein
MSSSFSGVPAGFRRCLFAALASFCVLFCATLASPVHASSKTRPAADAPSRPAKAARAVPARKAASARKSAKPSSGASSAARGSPSTPYRFASLPAIAHIIPAPTTRAAPFSIAPPTPPSEPKLPVSAM